MALRISHLTVDSHDAYAQSHWWSAALGWSEDPEDPNLPGHEECMIFAPDGRQRLLFIEVPEDKTVKNRLHLDLVPTDTSREAEVERLLGLGATQLADHRRPDGGGWVTLADPEGNELCVLRSELDRPDPYAHLVR
ncbi:VOC family protein [Microlunatus spumicola]|uniref:VOC family protein n=1 Tax=Microlunatus spumicola TaxID=81499 RepID=A0ABP6Y5I1_9ACTN